MYTNIIYANVN